MPTALKSSRLEAEEAYAGVVDYFAGGPQGQGGCRARAEFEDEVESYGLLGALRGPKMGPDSLSVDELSSPWSQAFCISSLVNVSVAMAHFTLLAFRSHLGSEKRKILDSSLGFAAGVMLAATFWSLLKPALDIAQERVRASASPGTEGLGNLAAVIPVAFGFLAGSLFVFLADLLLASMDGKSAALSLALSSSKKQDLDTNRSPGSVFSQEFAAAGSEYHSGGSSDGVQRRRTKNPLLRAESGDLDIGDLDVSGEEVVVSQHGASWRRIMLLIVAITVHNIPEGLAVGVTFAAVNKTPSATFESARNLAIGIGIQNFPEGLAVSLPLHGSGFSLWKSFWYGQLSGVVEPIAGLLGAFAVSYAEPLLPFALAFAGGAMVFVVLDDIIPEAQMSGNKRLASWSGIAGFLVMMVLDVAFGSEEAPTAAAAIL